MQYENLRIYLERGTWGDAFGVHIGSRINESRKFTVAQPLQFKEFSEDESLGVHHMPCLTLNTSDAQRLMDELWHVGVRPTEGTGSAGAMAAVQAHLKDMQRLVFERPQTDARIAPDWFKKSVGGISDDGK